MAIVPPTPIVIPAIPEKTFSEQWVYNLNVHAPTVSTGVVNIELLPYNSETQEIGAGSLMQPVRTDKLWQAINEVPEVAVAFQAVIDCVEPLRAWIELQNNPVIPPVVEPEPEPVIEPETVIEPEPIIEPESVVEPEPVVEPDPIVEPTEELLQQKRSTKKS
jgi:NDP-sugar pyrophosphorylase family protein